MISNGGAPVAGLLSSPQQSFLLHEKSFDDDTFQ